MPKVIKTRVCERCKTEQHVDEFRLANKKIGYVCQSCRSKCIVCNSIIPNPKDFKTKYCSDACRRVTDNLNRASKLKKIIAQNPEHYKQQYSTAKAKGWKKNDSERSKLYYETHKTDPDFKLNRNRHALNYYYKHRESILAKRKNMSDSERDTYNAKHRDWRAKRFNNLSEIEKLHLKQHYRMLNRQSRARQRLAKLRFDFAKIEEINNE